MIKQRLHGRWQEKNAVDQEIADGDMSERLRQSSSSSLTTEIAELSRSAAALRARAFQSRWPLSEYLTDFIKENPQGSTRIRLNRLLLEAAYPKDIARSLGGVYPDREIYIPTPGDSQNVLRRIPVGRRAAAGAQAA